MTTEQSKTELFEMLTIPREDIIEEYKQAVFDLDRTNNLEYKGKIEVIKSLFGDKCLPDKEQPKPKFKAGDIVIAKTWVGEQFPQKIVMVANDVAYFEKGNLAPIVDLEPYTEENKESMEKKELNLCELLKGCEEEWFYLLGHGDAKFTKFQHRQGRISQIDLKCQNKINQVYDTSVMPDGTWINGDSTVLLYPSRALYEKYPLDAYSAWMEWKETQKSKRWRAKLGEKYWLVDIELSPALSEEKNDGYDKARYNNGNYFRTQEAAEEAAKLVKEILLKFHEKKLK